MRMSVVVPSFNQAEFLPQTLDSLVGQEALRHGELEVIVVDGGSTDGSLAILRRYSSHLACWVSEPDRGQTHALIKGFAMATGDILTWLCSDDILEPNAAREVLDLFAARSDVDFVYGDGLWIDRAGRVLGPKKEIPFYWYIWLFGHNYIPQPSAFWRRELYEKVGGLDESFQLAMDADLWARFAQVRRPLHVRRMWSRMRRYPEQKNQRLRARSDVEDTLIRERIRNWPANGFTLKAAHVTARSLRIGLKLITGCYRLPETRPAISGHQAESEPAKAMVTNA